MIVVDAYFADSIPFHLATAQFFELVRSRLSPGGVVVSNVIGAIEGSDSKLLRSMTKTYRSVFPDRRAAIRSDGHGDYGNVILVATEGARPKQSVLQDNWKPPARAVAQGARPARGDRRPLGEARPVQRRSAADGRLRADRRAAHRLRG